MSRLRIFADTDPSTPLFASQEPEAIAAELGKIGVTFERWKASKPLPPGASQEDVLEAYKADIERISTERGFTTVDVAGITPDNPNKDAARTKFLDEHYHDEDEVRFFVEGSGLFVLHVGDKVYEVECVKDDLISVPHGATHWFDMGPEPRFTAIRFFQRPDGWIGHFTGTDIAQKFPRYDTPSQGA